jgi:hypothetical protein
VSRSTKWEVLGVQKWWADGAYAWAEEENTAASRRWAWHLLGPKDAPEPYEYDGTAPTLKLAMQRILAARAEVAR